MFGDEKLPSQKVKGLSSNHHFWGAKLLNFQWSNVCSSGSQQTVRPWVEDCQNFHGRTLGGYFKTFGVRVGKFGVKDDLELVVGKRLWKQMKLNLKLFLAFFGKVAT